MCGCRESEREQKEQNVNSSESGKRVDALFLSCNFSVSLKLIPNKKLGGKGCRRPEPGQRWPHWGIEKVKSGVIGRIGRDKEGGHLE